MVIVARQGKVAYFEAFGKSNVNANTPMQPDAIFRFRSMSKPITSVAALMLFDDGKFKLDANLSGIPLEAFLRLALQDIKATFLVRKHYIEITTWEAAVAHSDDPALARLLKEERLRQKLSLNVLSTRAGLNRQTVSFIEQEQRTPTVDTLLRLTDVLGVKLENLIHQARKIAAAN